MLWVVLHAMKKNKAGQENEELFGLLGKSCQWRVFATGRTPGQGESPGKMGEDPAEEGLPLVSRRPLPVAHQILAGLLMLLLLFSLPL